MEFLCRTAGLGPNGELIIFLHGFPESSIIWEKTTTKFADMGYRCLAPDQRGYYDFHELDAGHWLTEFNEPEISKIIINHIKRFSI